MSAGSVRRVFVVICACALIAVALLFVFAPLITAAAVRLWLSRVAQENALSISYGALDAPLLRPVTLRDVKIIAAGKTVAISRVDAELRLAAVFDRSRGRAIRNLVISDLRGEFVASPSPRFWAALLADSFSIDASAITVRAGTVTVELDGMELTANELKPGRLHVRRLSVQSPALAQSFADLRGGTSWEYNRLTIGGVTMMRGLDIDVVRVDLARASDKRIGIEADLDFFGGKLRASMSADEQDGKRTWDIAASASEVSIGRMSDALEFANRASGSLHALKFTFRGNFAAAADATASLWTEITGFTWRDRTADIVMLGASYYSQQIYVEQLYVKQRRNELTFSGEFGLPRPGGDIPELRGDLSATIADLGEFARLFGGNPADFTGQVAVNAVATAHEQNFTGEATVSGKALKVFGAPVDAIDAHLSLTRSAIAIDRCEIRRDAAGLPPLSISGSCDLTNTNAIDATLRFDQPLAISNRPSGCVSEIRLDDSFGAEPRDAIRFSTLEFTGPLLRSGWKVSARDGEDTPKEFTVCAPQGEQGGALVISPVR